jgi:hypothetical protein
MLPTIMVKSPTFTSGRWDKQCKTSLKFPGLQFIFETKNGCGGDEDEMFCYIQQKACM